MLAAQRAGYEHGGPTGAMAARAVLTAAEPGADPVGVASNYAAAGNADGAFAWLERASRAHSPGLPHMVGNPQFDPIHSETPYGELPRRMGLPA